jgi:hypothetical protein
VSLEEKRLLTITIPAIAPSANAFYAGMHPMKRRKLADQWHNLVGWCLEDQKVASYTLGYPVRIVCRCYFAAGDRRVDADNLFPTAKLIVDSLVRARVLENDSPRYVASLVLIPERTSLTECYTMVTIEPVKESP